MKIDKKEKKKIKKRIKKELKKEFKKKLKKRLKEELGQVSKYQTKKVLKIKKFCSREICQQTAKCHKLGC